MNGIITIFSHIVKYQIFKIQVLKISLSFSKSDIKPPFSWKVAYLYQKDLLEKYALTNKSSIHPSSRDSLCALILLMPLLRQNF